MERSHDGSGPVQPAGPHSAARAAREWKRDGEVPGPNRGDGRSARSRRADLPGDRSACGQKAVITGGDSGIGRAVALTFAREGADLLISYLESEEQDAQKTVALVEEAGRRAVTVPGDVREEAHCRHIVDRAVEEFGHIDVLVSNAAYQMSQSGGITEITTDQLDRVFKTNVYAMMTHCSPLTCVLRQEVDGAHHHQHDPPRRAALATVVLPAVVLASGSGPAVILCLGAHPESDPGRVRSASSRQLHPSLNPCHLSAADPSVATPCRPASRSHCRATRDPTPGGSGPPTTAGSPSRPAPRATPTEPPPTTVSPRRTGC